MRTTNEKVLRRPSTGVRDPADRATLRDDQRLPGTEGSNRVRSPTYGDRGRRGWGRTDNTTTIIRSVGSRSRGPLGQGIGRGTGTGTRTRRGSPGEEDVLGEGFAATADVGAPPRALETPATLDVWAGASRPSPGGAVFRGYPYFRFGAVSRAPSEKGFRTAKGLPGW